MFTGFGREPKSCECIGKFRWLVGGWRSNLELLNLSRLFSSRGKFFVFYWSTLASHAYVDEWKAFVVSPSPLFTLSLNIGKTIVKVKYLLASMTFLCYFSLLFRGKLIHLKKLSFHQVRRVCFISCLRAQAFHDDRESTHHPVGASVFVYGNRREGIRNQNEGTFNKMNRLKHAYQSQTLLAIDHKKLLLSLDA